MPRKKITQLEQVKFDGSQIDNLFYVDDLYNVRCTTFREIFDWIKETAIEQGLTVKLIENNIMFIKGNE